VASAGVREGTTAGESVESAGPPTSSPRSERIALGFFVAFLVIAGVGARAILRPLLWSTATSGISRQTQAGSLGNLVPGAQRASSLLPILVYRLLWNLFGLRTYVPYQIR